MFYGNARHTIDASKQEDGDCLSMIPPCHSAAQTTDWQLPMRLTCSRLWGSVMVPGGRQCHLNGTQWGWGEFRWIHWVSPLLRPAGTDWRETRRDMEWEWETLSTSPVPHVRQVTSVAWHIKKKTREITLNISKMFVQQPNGWAGRECSSCLTPVWWIRTHTDAQIFSCTCWFVGLSFLCLFYCQLDLTLFFDFFLNGWGIAHGLRPGWRCNTASRSQRVCKTMAAAIDKKMLKYCSSS